MSRRFVPFESLWQMPISVPYSLLVRDGDYAWTCGQLALDQASTVIAPNDLTAQSHVVAEYIDEVLRRGGLVTDDLQRVVVYYAPDGRADEGTVAELRSVFGGRLGQTVLIDPVPVPHFYYPGIMLEVDAFAGPSEGRVDWQSIELPVAELQRLSEVDSSGLLSAHWTVPESALVETAVELERHNLVHDRGAVLNAGPRSAFVRGVLVRSAGCEQRTTVHGDVALTSRWDDTQGWIAARCVDPSLGLVAQTEQIMQAIAQALGDAAASFADVVKSTTLYAGDSSAAALHDNMEVRNRRYTAPGPASTGLPVYGFAGDESQVTIDVTYLR